MISFGVEGISTLDSATMVRGSSFRAKDSARIIERRRKDANAHDLLLRGATIARLT